jgi:hypothetical protein
LARNGLVVRMVSQRLETILHTFETLRQAIRQHMGIVPEKLRK